MSLSVAPRKMSQFFATPGLNCNIGVVNMNSMPVFQNTSNLCTFTDWARPSRPCKDVLRQAIRVNRIKKGQVMPVIPKSSTIPLKRRKPMKGKIPEETLLKRQKNREAAKKCRLKKRKVLETLQEKIDKYKDRNRSLENDIKSYENEVTKLQNLLRELKCNKDQREQHCQDVAPGTSRQLSVVEIQHEVPSSTAAEDIADSLEDLLGMLQENDKWCEQLTHLM